MNLVVLARRLTSAPGEPAESLLGTCERAALDAALSLRGPDDRITVIAAGRADHERPHLTEALATGADHALCVEDPVLGALDYWGTARVLAAATERAGHDVVLCGVHSEEQGEGACGPAVAHWLGIVHVTGVTRLTRGDDGRLGAVRRADGMLYELAITPPALIAVVSHTGEAPGSHRAGEAPAVEILSLEDIGLTADELRHRDECLGRVLPAKRMSNATLVKGPAELFARLAEDRLLGT